MATPSIIGWRFVGWRTLRLEGGERDEADVTPNRNAETGDQRGAASDRQESEGRVGATLVVARGERTRATTRVAPTPVDRCRGIIPAASQTPLCRWDALTKARAVHPSSQLGLKQSQQQIRRHRAPVLDKLAATRPGKSAQEIWCPVASEATVPSVDEYRRDSAVRVSRNETPSSVQR